MPPQRSARGAYARYICTHCRSRKIKCALPPNLDIVPSGKPQPPELACQRCKDKGIECVVSYTTLGRPSQQTGVSTMRMRVSPGSVARVHSETSASNGDDLTPGEIDDCLLVRPQKHGDGEDTDNSNEKYSTTTEDNGTSESLDKFLALVSPPYLLSTLLLRDKQFATSVPSYSLGVDIDILDMLDLSVLDKRLVWHRLYYPDISPLLELHRQLQNKDEVAQHTVATSFLLILLCSLALETLRSQLDPHAELETKLACALQRYGNHLLLTLPPHRKTLLGLELMTMFRPLALASDRMTAVFAIRGRLTPPLMTGLALELRLDAAPAKLRNSVEPFSMTSLADTLQWYRIQLRDFGFLLVGEGRENETCVLQGELATDIVSFLQTICNGDIPIEALYPIHSLLCKARQLEDMLRIKEDWRNLENLARVFTDNLEACEKQRQQLRAQLRAKTTLRTGQGLAISHLIDQEVHRSFMHVSGYATFHSIIAGAEAARNATTGKDPSKEQMMELSDQIIERLAEPTKDFYAEDPYTKFLIQYGERRASDIEKAVSDFISSTDTLKLDGIQFAGSVRYFSFDMLLIVKELMEANAARMKGWAGLHARADIELLLIRQCASSLEKLGSGRDAAVAEGCLWTATARLLRSLHRLLSRWKEWNALGQARVSTPSLTPKGPASDQSLAMTGVEQNGVQDFADLELLPDDLFFDWNLWLNSKDSWAII